MKKRIFIALFFLSVSLQIIPQPGILNREDLLPVIREVLSLMYNYQSDEARNNLKVLQREMPGHPAVSFLEALLIYWKNYPLRPENNEASAFLSLMEDTMNKAALLLEQNPDDLEGIFFSLFGRAFYAMFWADNGKPNKVFPYLPMLYRETMKGMKRKNEFVEFYFSTGLYNYYIEAYPDKRPIYKPVSRLFKRGNREAGLKELRYCAENATFLRVEAKYFLSLLYLGYENNPKNASEFAADLYREFPKNTCYMGNYAYILLFDKKYSVAEIIIQNLARNSDTYSLMQTHILNGYLLEKYYKDYRSSFLKYEQGLKLADEFGETTNSFKSMAWMGLGRYYQREGNTHKAAGYFKLAKNTSPYDYLTEDK